MTDDIRAGQRIVLTSDFATAVYSAEDFMGVGTQRIFGTVIGTYGKTRYKVQIDSGEEILLFKNEFVLVDERASKGLDLLLLGSVLGLLTILAIAVYGVQP